MKERGTAPDRRWCNRPLVLERDHRRTLWLWAMLAAMVVAVLPSGAYLFHQNKCLEVSYRVGELAATRDLLVEEERRLRVRRAMLESLPSIETWARKQRLTRPPAQDVRVVGAEGPDSAVEKTRHASAANAYRTANAGLVSSER